VYPTLSIIFSVASHGGWGAYLDNRFGGFCEWERCQKCPPMHLAWSRKGWAGRTISSLWLQSRSAQTGMLRSVPLAHVTLHRHPRSNQVLRYASTIPFVFHVLHHPSDRMAMHHIGSEHNWKNLIIGYMGSSLCSLRNGDPWVKEIWCRSPIFCKHVFLWCLFFDPHRTTHQSSLGIRLRKWPQDICTPYNTFLTLRESWNKLRLRLTYVLDPYWPRGGASKAKNFQPSIM
jgi:hypothetical protein